MSLRAVSGNSRTQLERKVDDSAQGTSWLTVAMEERRPRCIWVGAPAVHGESSGSANTVSGVHGQGQLYFRLRLA